MPTSKMVECRAASRWFTMFGLHRVSLAQRAARGVRTVHLDPKAELIHVCCQYNISTGIVRSLWEVIFTFKENL